MELDTLIRNPIPVLPHHHLPWRMDAESNGLRSVKQAVSGIGTVGHYRIAQIRSECDDGYICVCAFSTPSFGNRHSIPLCCRM